MGGSGKAEGLGDGSTVFAWTHRQAALDNATRLGERCEIRVGGCYDE